MKFLDEAKVYIRSGDGGNGCVLPSAETVEDGTYAPLSRPLFVYVNAAWRRVLGYHGEEIHAFTLLSIVHPDSRARVHQLFERLREEEDSTRRRVAQVRADIGRLVEVLKSLGSRGLASVQANSCISS